MNLGWYFQFLLAKQGRIGIGFVQVLLHTTSSSPLFLLGNVFFLFSDFFLPLLFKEEDRDGGISSASISESSIAAFAVASAFVVTAASVAFLVAVFIIVAAAVSVVDAALFVAVRLDAVVAAISLPLAAPGVVAGHPSEEEGLPSSVSSSLLPGPSGALPDSSTAYE